MGALRLAAALAALLSSIGVSGAAVLPPIKAGSGNVVPVCVTPDRLTAFLKTRNARLSAAFEGLAAQYQRHGRMLGLRWDYAFFQMVVETNWLSYRTGSGRAGLVSPRQNNFAGIGATGRGHVGEAFADPSQGVLAHLQHVAMYAGETIEQPVATRTRLVQRWGEIPHWAHRFHRPVTFTDLTRKWSPRDRGYSDDIAAVAKQYFAHHCSVQVAVQAPTPALTPDPTPTGSVRVSLFRKLMF